MLVKDPSMRWSAQQCLQHEWFNIVKTKNVSRSEVSHALDNMKAFHSNSKLQMATYAYLTSYLMTQKEEQELRRIFSELDLNGDGEISKEEIRQGYEKISQTSYLSEEELNQLIDQIDIDKSGTINYQEFLMASVNKQQLIS